MAWYHGILISSLSYYNWIYDLWFNFKNRLSKAWVGQEGIWHINNISNKCYAYPANIMTGDKPEWIFNAETNEIIDTNAGLVEEDGFHHCDYIGGSLFQNNVECHDMTDFISSVRIFGDMPPIQIIVSAWAIKTGRDCLGWLQARRNDTIHAHMINRDADEEVLLL
jgi:hypothetical protein